MLTVDGVVMDVVDTFAEKESSAIPMHEAGDVRRWRHLVMPGWRTCRTFWSQRLHRS
jgi:hypothetical protein